MEKGVFIAIVAMLIAALAIGSTNVMAKKHGGSGISSDFQLGYKAGVAAADASGGSDKCPAGSGVEFCNGYVQGWNDENNKISG
jgi:hypothetical protein